MTSVSEELFNEVRKTLVAHGPHDYETLADVLCNLFANLLCRVPPDERHHQIMRMINAINQSLLFMDRTGGKGGVQ